MSRRYERARFVLPRPAQALRESLADGYGRTDLVALESAFERAVAQVRKAFE